MNKFIICALLFFITGNLHAQERTGNQLSIKDGYLRKSKHQKTAALILLGSGPALMVTSIAVAISSIDLDGNARVQKKYDKITRGLLIGGIGATVGSFPLFIASNRNKKKAVLFSGTLKIEKSKLIHLAALIPDGFPAISIRILFR